jgi:hypothetical protein
MSLSYIANILKFVTDLINALPGNSSVNMVLHATIEEPVFSMRLRQATMKEAMFLCHDVTNDRDSAFYGVCAESL